MSGSVSKGEEREDALKLLLGRICCVVGLLFGTGGIVFAILGTSVNLSAGAVEIALSILGYFLGASRLGAASVVLGTAAVFFMAAASTGLIPRRRTPGARIQLVKPGWGTQVVHPREGKELPLCLP